MKMLQVILLVYLSKLTKIIVTLHKQVLFIKASGFFERKSLTSFVQSNENSQCFDLGNDLLGKLENVIKQMS